MTRNLLRMFKNTKIEIWQYIFLQIKSLVDKKNSIWRKKGPKTNIYRLN